MHSQRSGVVGAAFAFIACGIQLHAATIHPKWARQFGTDGDDILFDVVVDGNENSYVVGYSPLVEGSQVQPLLQKYDPAGNLTWSTRLPSSPVSGGAFAVSLDQGGNVVVGGSAPWQWNDQHSFLAKFTPTGDLQWERQVNFNSTIEGINGVAVAGDGSIYAAGFSAGDAFLAKWSSEGEHQWLRRIGSTRSDYGTSVGVDDDGNIIVAGSTEGTLITPVLGERDAFLARFTPMGDRLWLQQISEPLEGADMVVAPNAVYLTGVMGTTLTSNLDSYIAKFNLDGQSEWSKSLGIDGDDFTLSIALTASEDVFVAGGTSLSDGNREVFLACVGGNGDVRTVDGISDNFGMTIHSIAIAGNSVWGVGRSVYSDVSPNVGDFDAVVVRLNIPEPSTMGLCCILAGALFTRCIRSSLLTVPKR